MCIENKIFEEDLEYINSVNFIDWNKLTGKTIFVTGATGLIGYYFVSALIYRNVKYQSNIKIIALVRDKEKAQQKFAEQLKAEYNLIFVVGDVENLPEIEGEIDYIIHGASPTASKYFVEYPVETIKTSVQGTIKILELAKAKQVQSIVYLSSMEVYGAPLSGELIPESQGTTVDTMSVRSCYPEAKRLCETLCASYSDEYGVPARVIRLAQTFGPGVSKDDNRVFAEFARCALAGKDIFLQTAGTSERCYLYNADVVTSILTILTKGNNGEAYNAANPNTYCSIVEMAQMVAEELGLNKMKVVIPTNRDQEYKYPATHRLKLDVSKLQVLGWDATVGLKDMYLRMMKWYEE